ncbi:Exocyst complex component 7 [Brachionus plicatilis]|uniref:Exocyst complex component 7 n=1 Tax=Brachionus plicatilis TaxID=10195 RepID=A0A3M7Q0Y4_BRAPC|nr:Exocyst complex component 7 [Brachionus plicatilis]
MVYEDTYRLRQINDLKIQQDLNSINLMKKCLDESKEQTNKMTCLLDGIEIRLSGLHDLIVPVYDSTNTLQIKHSNLQKAVVQLDNILEYYDAVKNLSLVIQAGPGQNINTYLNQMDKLRSAIQYFTINKNKSQKSENEDLWVKGKMNVDREFESYLNKFNVITANVTSDNLDQADSGKLYGPKENDLNQMKNIMEWFKKTEPTHLDKLYEKIINNRSQLILDNLKNIKGKANSLNNSANSAAYNSSHSNSSQFSKRNSLAPQSPGSNLNNSIGDNTDSKRTTLRSRLT